MATIPYSDMKMTMHIDEDVLSEVMKITGSTSKTGAVEKALGEMVRRNRLKNVLREGMGMTSEEIKASFDFDTYDSLNSSEPIEQKPVTYPKASRSKKTAK